MSGRFKNLAFFLTLIKMIFSQNDSDYLSVQNIRDEWILLNLLVIIIYIYIYLLWLSVCLYPINVDQNSWTDQAQMFCDTGHKTLGKVYEWSKFQKFASNKILSPINFQNSRHILIKSANFFVCFCFTMYFKEKMLINFNRIWARNALKAY